MRIGIDALSLIPGRTGGIETCIVNLVKEFGAIAADHEFVVFTLPQSKERLSVDFPNIRFETCRMPVPGKLTVPSRLIYEQLVLPGRIRHSQIDVMLFAASIMSFRCPCKSVLVVYDLISMAYAEQYPGKMGYFKERALPRLIQASAKRADRVAAISDFTRKELITRLGIAADKIDVVYLGISDDLGKVDQEKPRDERVIEATSGPYVLFVGYQHLHKNLDRLVRAYALMKDRTGLPHRLVLAGKEETGTPALQEELRLLNRSDIVLLGRVSAEDVSHLYRNASLFVFPPLMEGFGLPPLEAMACGVPVAASNVGPIPEVVGDAAIMFDPLDVEDMARAIEVGLTDSKLREELRRMGFARVGEGTVFSWKKTATGLLSMAAELNERPPLTNAR